MDYVNTFGYSWMQTDRLDKLVSFIFLSYEKHSNSLLMCFFLAYKGEPYLNTVFCMKVLQLSYSACLGSATALDRVFIHPVY